MKLLAKLLLIAVGLGLIYVLFIASQVWFKSNNDTAKPGADAIVVLGAAQYNGKPSPVLRARLDHAADLWNRKYAPIIVVTGGKVPGDNSTEASASAAYLGTKGVPDASVLREVQGRSSWESLQATARFLKKRDATNVILVSDGFHNARIESMAKDLGLNPEVSPTTTSPIEGAKQLRYMAKEVVSLGLGEILGFRRVAALEKSFVAS